MGDLVLGRRGSGRARIGAPRTGPGGPVGPEARQVRERVRGGQIHPAAGYAAPPVRRRWIWLLASLLACAGGDAARPVLRDGTSGDYAPFSERDVAGLRAGFDVDVARAYARERGLEI